MSAVSQIMSTDVQVLGPQESLRHAAQRMQSLDVGALPVCNGRRLLGMVTDRDITVRGVAQGLNPEQACVSDVMTEGVQCCSAEQDSAEVLRLMGDSQVRRMPVIDKDRNLVGIVSMADLARKQGAHIDKAMSDISRPDQARS